MPSNAPLIPQPSPIPFPAVWGATTTQSAYSNDPSVIPVAPYGTVADTYGCFWDIPNLVTLAPSATYQIPYGNGYIVTGSIVNGLAVQLNVGGSWTTIKLLSPNDAWPYWSDYANVQLLNGNSGTTGLTIYPQRAR